MIRKMVLLIVLFALLGIGIYLAYNLYMDNSKIIEIFEVDVNTSQPSYDSEFQFYSNMRFNKRGISYQINNDCDAEKVQNAKSAFDFLENKTKLIFFVSENSDINISCGEQYLKEDLFVAGEGGPSKFVDTGLYNVILEGKIVLFYEESCGYNVEMHELLHVLGFEHSNNPASVMYNLSNCNQVLTEDIINEINRLYEDPALSDLYFANISAFKHGRYLDINLTVRNQGLIDAKGVSVEIYSGEKIDSLDLGEIEFGSGKVISVANLRLPSRDIEQIEVYIDKETLISELNKENNKAVLFLSK